jgi:hypothetical protein
VDTVLDQAVTSLPMGTHPPPLLPLKARQQQDLTPICQPLLPLLLLLRMQLAVLVPRVQH